MEPPNSSAKKVRPATNGGPLSIHKLLSIGTAMDYSLLLLGTSKIMKAHRHGVVLVGHGGIPKDFPRSLLVRLKSLEAERRANGSAPTPDEIELETSLRRWPRTVENDPYHAGLEALAAQLTPLLNGSLLRLAYNEFCAPTIEEAIESMAVDGVSSITVIPTMVTPGGSHSEIEIPAILRRVRCRYPEMAIRYAWPFDLSAVASLLAAQVKRFDP